MSEAMQMRQAPPVTAAPSEPFEVWSPEIVERTEVALARYLPSADTLPATLHEAMRYATLGGGKRIRALLCHAAGAAVNAAPSALDAVASAVEMVHAYSLVHDDLPAMDNDLLRRGQPTVHVRYGEAVAILVGDALQAQAFEVLADMPLSAEQRILLLQELGKASGSLGLVGGQAIDLASTGHALAREQLEEMHQMKTGALLRAAVFMGAHCGPEPMDAQTKLALDEYQRAIGLAFQVVDDILDVTTDVATLGKTPGKDAEANKATYVTSLGLEASRQFAQQLAERARAALQPLGARAVYLDALIDQVVRRVH